VGIATSISAVPQWLTLDGIARKCCQALVIALILSGGGAIARQSAHLLSLRDQSVGTGPDQFYVFNPRVDASGTLLELARRHLAADPSAHTLLVLPEGVMLNYLTRLPNPLPNFFFGPNVFTPESRRMLLEKLAADPPDRVVVISRDLREYGVERFGNSPEHGRELLEFVQDHYYTDYRIGADPLDVRQRGMVVNALRGAPETPAGQSNR
jgi:hypothetical protein